MPPKNWTGRDVAAARARAYLTQAELGRLLGVSKTRISHVETSIRVSAAFAARVQRALRSHTRRADR
jgi:transcriptional regulator with XRE-family HTH domain